MSRARVFYKGEKPGKGKLVVIEEISNLRSILMNDLDVNLDRFAIWWYNMKDKGFERLLDGSDIDLSLISVDGVLDICLEEKPEVSQASKISLTVPEGFFGIGVVRGPSRADSLAVLWRSAFQMGAKFVFTVSGDSEVASADAFEGEDSKIALRSIPYWRFEQWEHMATSIPAGAPLVALEMGGTPLETFEHPPCAVYILGNERDGIPKSVLDACHYKVEIPSIRAQSYNIGAAASILMYDRLAKERFRKQV